MIGSGAGRLRSAIVVVLLRPIVGQRTPTTREPLQVELSAASRSPGRRSGLLGSSLDAVRAPSLGGAAGLGRYVWGRSDGLAQNVAAKRRVAG